MRCAGPLLLCALAAALPAGAQYWDTGSAPPPPAPPKPRILDEVGIEQRLNAQVPLDLEFRDEAGRAVRLRDYFGSRPVILTLNYYECPMLCTVELNALVHTLRALSLSAGKEFEIVTVSFDAREKPPLAAEKKLAYLDRYRRAGAERGWHFLTGDETPIRALTRAVGFRYAYDAEHRQFAHAGGIFVLTPAGKLARYFYGIRYSPRDLRLALVEASAEKIGSPVDRVLLLCYEYDPRLGKYTATIMKILRASGVATLLTIAGLYVFLLRKERRVVS